MGLGLVLAGSVFFPLANFLTNKILPIWTKNSLNGRDYRFIAVLVVSFVQAVFSIICGSIIVQSCQTDIMTDSHWLVNDYTCFGLPYFFYDIIAMYMVHIEQNSKILDGKSLTFGCLHFVRRNIAMVIHHVIFPIVFFPVIMFLRNGKGDFFVGTLFLVEIANPFLIARKLLLYLKMENSVVYVVVGVSVIITFFISRVCVFPFLYWKYASHAGIPVMSVPFQIPFHCNLGSIVFISLQLYWWILIVRVAVRTVHKLHNRYDSKQIS